MCEMMDISANKNKDKLCFYQKPGSILNVKCKHLDNVNSESTNSEKQFVIQKNIIFDNETSLENNIVKHLDSSHTKKMANQKFLKNEITVSNELSNDQQDTDDSNKIAEFNDAKGSTYLNTLTDSNYNRPYDKDDRISFCVKPNDKEISMDQIFVLKNLKGLVDANSYSSKSSNRMTEENTSTVAVKNIATVTHSETQTTVNKQAEVIRNDPNSKVLHRRSLLKTRPNILRESKMVQGVSILKSQSVEKPTKQTDNEMNSSVDKLINTCTVDKLNQTQSKYATLLNTKLNKVHNPVKVNKVLKKVSSKIVLDSYHYDPSLPAEPVDATYIPLKTEVTEPEKEFYPNLQIPVGLFVNKNFIAKEEDMEYNQNAKSMAVVSISTDKSNNTTQIIINTSQGEQIFQGKTSDLLEATSHGTEEWARSLAPRIIKEEIEEDIDGDLEEGEPLNDTECEIQHTEESEIQTNEEEEDNPKDYENNSDFLSSDVPGMDDSPVMDALENIGITSDQLFSIITGNGSRLWICAERGCGQLFSRLASLKIHILEHYKIKPFRCSFDDCEWAFYSSFKLKRHKETHTKAKDFKCTEPDCDRRFTTVSNLRQHIKLHRRPANFSCCVDDCTLIFQTKRSYEMHLKTHKGAEAPYKCPVETCDKAYFSFSSLNSHSRSHQHKEEEIKCSWEGCGKIFDQPCRLKAHMRQHTGDKPYKCYFPNCNWSFTSSSKLRRHQKKHSKERKFSCTIEGCGKAFMRSEHLREHVLTHFGNRSYTCPVDGCKIVFPAKSTLYKHVLHVHKNNKSKPKSNISNKKVVQNIKNESENTNNIKYKNINKNHQTTTNSAQSDSLSKSHPSGFDHETLLTPCEYAGEAFYACGVEHCSVVCTGKDLNEHMLRNHTAFVSSDDGTQYGCVSLLSDQNTELASEVSISTEEISNEPYLINLSEYTVEDCALELNRTMYSTDKFTMLPKNSYDNSEDADSQLISEEINIESNEDHTTKESNKTDDFTFKYLIDTQNIQVKNLLNNPEMEIRAVYQNKFCEEGDNDKITLNYDVIVPEDSYIDFVGTDNEESGDDCKVPVLSEQSVLEAGDTSGSEEDENFDNVLVDPSAYTALKEGESKTVHKSILNQAAAVNIKMEKVEEDSVIDNNPAITNTTKLSCARTFLTYQKYRQLREKAKQHIDEKQEFSAMGKALPIQTFNYITAEHDVCNYASQNVYGVSSLSNRNNDLKIKYIENVKPNINNLNSDMLNKNNLIQIDKTSKSQSDSNNRIRSINNIKKISLNTLEQSESSPLQITSNPMMTYAMIDEKILDQSTNECLDEDLLSVNTENISMNSLLMTNDLSGAGLYDQDDVSQFPVLLMDPTGSHVIDYPENTINLRDFE